MALWQGGQIWYDVDVHVNTFTTIYHISPSLKKISGNKKLDQRSGANSKNLIFCWILQLTFSVFTSSAFPGQKHWKTTIKPVKIYNTELLYSERLHMGSLVSKLKFDPVEFTFNLTCHLLSRFFEATVVYEYHVNPLTNETVSYKLILEPTEMRTGEKSEKFVSATCKYFC